MSGGIGSLVASGPLILAVPVALAAGAVTFLSPCCLPLVPGYLSYVTGMSGVDASEASDVPGAAAAAAAGASPGNLAMAADGGSVATATYRAAAGMPSRSRVVAGAMLFVLGFSVLFASYGVLFGGLGTALLEPSAGGDPDPRRRDDRARPDVRRRLRPVHDHRADRAPVVAPARRAGRGAAARHHVRADLDAMHRPDADGGPAAVRDVRHGGPRRVPRVRVRARHRDPVPDRRDRLPAGHEPCSASPGGTPG